MLLNSIFQKDNPAIHGLKRALCVAAVPLAEGIFLRFYLHSILKIRIGWGWFVSDYDLGLPCVVGFLLLFFLLDKGSPCSPRPQWTTLKINALIFASFLLLSQFYTPQNSFYFRCIWWICLTSVFVFAWFSFLPLRYFCKNPNRSAILFCIPIGLSQILYLHTFSFFWPWLFPMTGSLSCTTLRALVGNSLQCGFGDPKNYYILHEFFRITLGVGCGGFDGIFFFLFASLFFWIMNRNTLSVWRIIPILGVGLIGMYFLNVIRIVILFLLGMALTRIMPPQQAYPIVMQVFHTNIGWILYATAIGTYFKLITSWNLIEGRRKHAFTPT